jgi:energy-coupling factor transport system substrate-specific component
MTITESAPTRRRITFSWRVVDIVVAAVLAVASGVIFWGWDAVWTPLSKPLDALLPGVDGILNGVWLFAAVLVALIVRRPGAALFAEVVAASVEALLGNQWGGLTLVSGLIQGLGAEIIFALFLYSSWRVGTAILAGIAAAIGLTILDVAIYYAAAKPAFLTIYATTSLLSGALVAGLLSWIVVRALARTGVLTRFASGRSSRALV